MRYFIHIVTDSERIRDPEGTEFQSLEDARVEAVQSARDLMAGELAAGRPVPLRWRAQVADDAGAILLTISFAALVFAASEQDRAQLDRFLPRVTDGEVLGRARTIIAQLRSNQSEIQHGLSELRTQLIALARLSATLPKR